MRNMMTVLLATTAIHTAFPRAGENKPGWKMDGDKLALDGNGNPIYVNSEGAEQSVKGDTIATLNSEAKNHRTAKEAAEAQLAKFKVDGKLIDPDAAVKAIQTVSNIDAKKLIDSGEVDKVRDQMRQEFTTQLNEKDTRINELTGTNKTLLVDKAFDSSQFVRDRLAVPIDMFRDSFGKNVRVGDDGKIEYYGRDGNRLLSKKAAGEYATGDEAFELMIEQHPQKDTILKANQNGGTGNDGNGGGRGRGRTISRTDFEALPPGEQAAIATKGEVAIVD